MEHGGAVYILTNKHHTTLYTGVTSDLFIRVTEHRSKIHPGSFSGRYNLDKLVYFELFFSIGEALKREKQIKGGSRMKKIALINKMNPEWKDLYEEIAAW